jgi:protein-arginine kinase activator protein McsA
MKDSNSPQFQEIKQLMEEKDKLVQEGKYLEAEEIKEKIKNMKKNSNTQKV